MQSCLNKDFEKLIVYKKDGSVDHKESHFEELEQITIEYLNLAQELHVMVDERLEEGFVAGLVEKAGIEKLEESQINELETLDQ